MTTMATKEKKTLMYCNVLKDGNKWKNHPTENTMLKWVNPDDIVDVIHRLIDNRLWNNIEQYVSAGIFAGVPIIRVNLDYSNYIQVERIDTKYGNGAYVIRLFIGKGSNDSCYVTITDKMSVISIIHSIKDNEFFAKWRKKIAAADFDCEEFEPCPKLPALGVAFI